MSTPNRRPEAVEPETAAGNMAKWDELDELSIPDMFDAIAKICQSSESEQES